LLGSGAVTTQTTIVFARVLVRITERVALEIPKGRLRILATVNGHATVETDFVALLAERLIAGAGVSNG